MKFQKLEIKNIASIGDATITFDSVPIVNEPLFLISGATGSGKSTILDAICLALYGTAPRLEGYGNESYEDKKLNLAGGDDNVKVGNPCQLVRRDTGEAYARLTFIGNDHKHYIATWHAIRGSKRKLDVKLKAESTLYCEESGVTINKRITEEISRPEVVGLKFEEFCRTTLLAQGAFTRFLNSKSSEKSDILEKLTGTEVYSQISKQIYRTYTLKNQQYEEKKQLINQYKLLSSEEREEKHNLIIELEKNILTLKKEIEELDSKIVWLNSFEEYNRLLKIEEERLKSIIEKNKSPEIISEKKLIEEWNITEEIRRNYHLHSKLLLEREKNVHDEKSLHNDYIRLANDEFAMQDVFTNLSSRQKSLQEKLENASKDVIMYENSAFLITKMQELLRKQEEISRIEKDISIKEKELPFIYIKIEQLTSERKKLEDKLITSEKRHNVIDNEFKQQPSTADINKHKENIEQLFSINKECVLLRERKIKLHKKLADLEKELHKFKLEFLHLEKQKEEIAKERKEKENLYNAIHLCIDDHAKALRSKLQIGDICPVCGEEIQKLFRDEEIEKLLHPLELQLNEVIDREVTTIAAYNKISAMIDTCKNLQYDARKQYDSEINKENELNIQIEEICRQIGKTDTSNLEEFINNERTKATKQIQKNENLSQTLLTLSDELTFIRRQLSSIMEKYALTLSNQKQIEKTIELHTQQLQTDKSRAKELYKEIAMYVTIDNWDKNLQQSIDELQKRSLAYNKANELNNQLKQEIKVLKELCLRIEQHRKNVEKLQTAWLPEINRLGKFTNNIENEWVELLNKCIVYKNNTERVEKEIESCECNFKIFYEKNPEINCDKLARLCNLSNDEIIEISNRLIILKQEEERVQTIVNEWRRKCENHICNRPQMENDETVCSLKIKKEKLEELRSDKEKKVGGYSLELKQDFNNRVYVEKEYTEAILLENETSKWKRLSDIFGSAEGQKFKSIAQSYILMQLLENANYYLRQFTSRYELIAQPGSLVILINDKDEGNTARPANTLSGGESFMISLALALGLSSLNNNNFTPDTIFIDEGFGTLSGDCLNTVIETLEVLHCIGNRKVGIISHVNELYERISTRIEVKKCKGVSEIKIVG